MGTIIKTELRQRGPLGKFFKVLFVIFNLFMVMWLIGYWTEAVSPVDIETQRTSAAIGTSLGSTLIVVLWAAGDVVLGLMALLTRGKKIIVEETAI